MLLLALSLGGCAIKLVADYDSVTYEEIIKVGKKVDKFYGDLLEAPAGDRGYKKFSERYVDVETDIRSLVTRNQARALNEESTEISEITLKLWIKYKDQHQSRNAYPDGIAKLDRKRFTRLFASAASAEQAKKLDADDKDPAKDSKEAK
ncbi:MAG TPA: hypothetical protein VLV90_13400 [Burkholderiales bacterium]|nr:hypothetical protein [Burkholderiales bacterium]